MRSSQHCAQRTGWIPENVDTRLQMAGPDLRREPAGGGAEPARFVLEPPAE